MTKKLWIILILILILGTVCKKNSDVIDYAPVLMSPANGTTISENPPTLTWERLYDRQYYEVLLSENGSFTLPSEFLTWADFEATTASFTLPVELNPGTYYWKVRWAGDPGG
jgi:hypothetical protein